MGKLSRESIRFLEETSADTLEYIIAIVGVIIVTVVVGVYCWRKRRGREQVEFEIFTNEASAPTSKEANNASGTTDVIGLESKESVNSKDDEDITNDTNDVSNCKKRVVMDVGDDTLFQHSKIPF